MKKSKTKYVSPVHYSPAELLEFQIQDLESDIRCAERDGLPDYAEECRRELQLLILKRDLQ